MKNKIIYRLLTILCALTFVDAAVKTNEIFNWIMPDTTLKFFLGSMALLMALGMLYMIVYFWKRSNKY